MTLTGKSVLPEILDTIENMIERLAISLPHTVLYISLAEYKVGIDSGRMAFRPTSHYAGTFKAIPAKGDVDGGAMASWRDCPFRTRASRRDDIHEASAAG